jgi:hypothetical protein
MCDTLLNTIALTFMFPGDPENKTKLKRYTEQVNAK